ncbi:MAG: molybdenum ABC transporter ATP-binding protein [Candidatus Binataceae bacterium]|jgi:molybdate transport system ATP-binding protein
MTGAADAELTAVIRQSFGANFILEIDFAAPAGITILFGASGSGKSTLLNCIAGLVTPDIGRIVLGSRVLFDASADINVAAAKRGVAYLFQDLALFPHMTIQRNIMYGLAHLPRAVRRERAAAIAASFKITHLLQRRPAELSGGERQRAALARSLVTDPAALLLDEPLAALDQIVKAAIVDDLRAWNAAHQIPIIYVTHAAEEAYALGARMIVLEHGRMLAQGTPQQVLQSPRHERMAQLAGFENVFDAEVISLDEAQGTMACRLDGSAIVLEAPLTRFARDGAARVAIRAGDIMLAIARPQGLSARNVLSGMVQSIVQAGAKVITMIDAGGVMFEVHLTPNARDELQLAPGVPVWLIVKTYSCHLVEVAPG